MRLNVPACESVIDRSPEELEGQKHVTLTWSLAQPVADPGFEFRVCLVKTSRYKMV